MRLIDYIESKLEFQFSVPTMKIVRLLAVMTLKELLERCRKQWGLGLAPISNMNNL